MGIGELVPVSRTRKFAKLEPENPYLPVCLPEHGHNQVHKGLPTERL